MGRKAKVSTLFRGEASRNGRIGATRRSFGCVFAVVALEGDHVAEGVLPDDPLRHGHFLAVDGRGGKRERRLAVSAGRALWRIERRRHCPAVGSRTEKGNCENERVVFGAARAGPSSPMGRLIPIIGRFIQPCPLGPNADFIANAIRAFSQPTG